MSIFVGGPVVLLLTTAVHARQAWAWSAAVVQAIIFVGIALWLLLAIWQ